MQTKGFIGMKPMKPGERGTRMKISTKGRYALRMVLDMARHQTADGAVALKDIAERQQVSKKYLEQIALALSRANILQGTRGHQGGYRLMMQPAELTVYDVLAVAEGSMHPVACLDDAPNTCGRCADCSTLPVWEGLDRVIRTYLSSLSIQDVLDMSTEK